jgi:alpha-tubulin suppressor-like RCC1 family protein
VPTDLDAATPMDAPTAADAHEVGPGAPDGGTLGSLRRLCLGTQHACAVRPDGRVSCWGSNYGRQLGDGTTATRRVHETCVGGVFPEGFDCAPRPTTFVRVSNGVDVAGDLSDVVSVACGETHTCALTNTGRVYCWGIGEEALGHAENVFVAAAVTDRTERFVSLTSGRDHACAIREDGVVRCWGANAQGGTVDDRLGLDTTVMATRTPTEAPDFAGALDLAAGQYWTCALEAGGRVRCQGLDGAHETGSATSGPVPEGNAVRTSTGELDRVSDLGSGLVHVCAVRDGEVLCWGGNQELELAGPGGSLCGGAACRSTAEPVEIGALEPLRFVAVSRGLASTSCAVTDAGTVHCWGANNRGQAGYDGPERVGRVASPVRTESGELAGIVEVEVGGETSCARTADDHVYCWGRASYGQLGDGTLDTLVPDAGLALDAGVVVTDHPVAREVVFP